MVAVLWSYLFFNFFGWSFGYYWLARRWSQLGLLCLPLFNHSCTMYAHASSKWIKTLHGYIKSEMIVTLCTYHPTKLVQNVILDTWCTLCSSYIEDKHGSPAVPCQEQTRLVSSLPARLEDLHHTGSVASPARMHPLQWHHGLAYNK